MSEHRAHRPQDHGPTQAVGFGLLTVSDTRTQENDLSGRTMHELVLAAGHLVQGAAIVPDEPERVRAQIQEWGAAPGFDAIVSSGGTGLSARDRTVEAVTDLFEVRIEGFGELFRYLSFQQIGPAAMLSRAMAGVVRGTPVFLLPGSPAAVRLALERLVLPEITHVLGELQRHGAAAP